MRRPGPALPARFVGFNYDGIAIAALPGFDTTPFPTPYGGRVFLADVTGNSQGELLAGAGPSLAAAALGNAFVYAVATLTFLPPGFDAFPGTTYGLELAAGDYGY